MEIWDLIAKQLAGQLSLEEERALSAWMKDPDNARTLEQTRRSWEAAAALNSAIAPDTISAWEKLKARLQQSSEPKVRPLEVLRRHWMKAAAALLLVLGCVLALRYITTEDPAPPPFTQTVRPLELLEVATTDSTQAIGLPDSSSVMLNQHSFLSYAKNFTDTARIVYLSGEAYFQVSPGDPRPFIVYAGGTEVRVMGTSFNVKANATDKKVEVVVDEGMVAFRELGAPDNSTIILKRSDKVSFDKEKRESTREQVKTREKIWWEKLGEKTRNFFDKLKRKKK